MKIKTNVKSGGISPNHNETLSGSAKVAGFKIKTKVKAGGHGINHNETVAPAKA